MQNLTVNGIVIIHENTWKVQINFSRKHCVLVTSDKKSITFYRNIETFLEFCQNDEILKVKKLGIELSNTPPEPDDNDRDYEKRIHVIR